MKILSWFLVLAGVCGLVGVRMLEDAIFYDPFLNYFHEANKNISLPQFEWGKLILSHLFRFILNLFFSCIIIHFLFKTKKDDARSGFNHDYFRHYISYLSLLYL